MRYVVRVTPHPRLEMEPFDLGPYRWRWLANLRHQHFLRDPWLRSTSTSEVREVR